MRAPSTERSLGVSSGRGGLGAAVGRPPISCGAGFARERVVRREFRLAGDETNLAVEGALDTVDAHGRRRADFHARANGFGHVHARERRAGREQHGDRGTARGLLAHVERQRVDAAGDG
jgi:hypothetical protein